MDNFSVEFQIRVFIPGRIPGLTEKIREGPLAGKTAIPDPIPDQVPIYAPGIPVPLNIELGTYLWKTDQRSFSSEHDASSRIRARLRINFTSGVFGIGEPIARCDPTTRIDVSDSGSLTVETATPSVTLYRDPYSTNNVWLQSRSYVPEEINQIRGRCFRGGSGGGSGGSLRSRTSLDLRIAAGNPIPIGSPDADFRIFIVLDGISRCCSYGIWHDGFPAYEVYAVIGSRHPLRLHHYFPEDANTLSLFGPGNDISARGTFTI